MKKLMTILTGCAMLLFSFSQGLCFEAAATINKNSISINDSVILRITIKDGKGDVDTSVIKDFRVAPQGSSTSISIINTKYSKTVSKTFLLFPLKSGTLIIPELIVKDGTRTAKTERITIQVSHQQQNNTVPENFFARSTISHTSLFTGQEAIYTFKLFSAANFYDARLIEPEFKACAVKKLEKKEAYTENINGRMYGVNEVNYLITPEKPGELIISPASVTMQILLEDQHSRGFGFDSFFPGKRTVKTITSNPIKIEVRPLPEYKGRGKYTGLIGDFDIKARLDRPDLMVGESATLTITIAGRGNIMDSLVESPDLPEKAFKIYDDKPEQYNKADDRGYYRKKIFKKALVPLKPGDFNIPPIAITYFDTGLEKYKTILTDPIALKVRKSANGDTSDLQPMDIINNKNSRSRERVHFTGKDILPLKEGADVLKNHKEPDFSSFVLLVLSPLILLCFVSFIKLFQKKEKSNSSLMKQRAKTFMKKAMEPGIGKAQFLSYLRTAYVSAILAKGDIKGEALTKEEAFDVLLQSNMDRDKIDKIIRAFKEIESAKYGGEALSKNKQQELLDIVKNLITLCSMILMLTICLNFAAPAGAKADESGTLFLKGVKEYKAGNFKEAAHNFEQTASQGIRNGKLFYNTANAYLKAGDVGRAMVWYERARRLIPFDADLMFNLNYAREKLKDIKDSGSLTFLDILSPFGKYLPTRLIRYCAVFLSFAFFILAMFRIYKGRKIFTLSASIIFTAFMLTLGTALFDYYQTANFSFAIIIPEKVSVRSGLSEDSTELFILHAGTKVRVDNKKEKYLKVFFSRGKLGWIKNNEAIII